MPVGALMAWPGAPRKRKPTRLTQLRAYAKDQGLHVATWSPGDGMTRYRFFDRPGNSYSGPDNGICTELGLKAAWKYLQSGRCSISRGRRR